MTVLNKINISKNAESIIEDYHTPEFISEVVTVRNNILNLTEVPSEDYSVEIEDYTEVTDFDLLSSNTVDDLFYVNYKQGYITLNKEHNFEKITVNYYGIGKSYLSAFRVYVGTDSTGNVAETLGDLFKTGEDIVESLEVYGGYATMILRMDSTTEECNALLNRIDQKITQIKSTDCQSTMITLTDWKSSSDGIYDYESSISHTLLSTNILCEFENSAGVSINDGSVKYKVVSNDKIKVYSNSRLPIKVKYMARYYNGLDSTNVTKLRQELEDSRMDSVNDIIYSSLKNRLTDMENEIKNICFIMPEPLTVSENNEYISKYMKVAKLGYHVTIKFMKGTYKFNSIFMESNIELIGNDTVFEQQLNTIYNPETGSNISLTPFICLTKPFDETSNNITDYNGNHNITVKGITFDSYNAFLMAHNKNITIENCKFINTKSDHVFQIAASKNVTIKRCDFEGLRNSASDRQFVEMVQIDYMNSTSQPYWITSANIYDHCPNNNIIIEDCTFDKGEGIYGYFKTGIGSHGADETDVKNKNITIKRCTFNNFEYAGITARYMDGVTIEDCNFNSSNNSQGVVCTNSNNVTIKGRNSFNGFMNRAIYTSQCDKIRMNGCNLNELTCSSDFMLMGESNDVIIHDISINNSTSEGYGILLRNVTDTIVNNISDNSNVITNGKFIRLYNSDENECSRISINNISTPNVPLSVSGTVTKICSPYVRETLWEGNVTSKGIITLPESLNKFKDVRIKIGMGGNIEKQLTFPKGYSKCILRDFNMADDTSNISYISFFEINLNKNSETELEVLNINRVDLGATTISPVAEGSVTIYGVYGERISY